MVLAKIYRGGRLSFCSVLSFEWTKSLLFVQLCKHLDQNLHYACIFMLFARHTSYIARSALAGNDFYHPVMFPRNEFFQVVFSLKSHTLFYYSVARYHFFDCKITTFVLYMQIIMQKNAIFRFFAIAN